MKDQAAQLRLFRRVMPSSFRKRISAEKETAELPGDEHDLCLCPQRLRACRAPASRGSASRCAPHGDRAATKRPCAQRRSASGERFSSEKAKDLVRKISEAMGQGDCSQTEARITPPTPGAGGSSASYFSSAVKTPSHCCGGFS